MVHHNFLQSVYKINDIIRVILSQNTCHSFQKNLEINDLQLVRSHIQTQSNIGVIIGDLVNHLIVCLDKKL